MKVIVEPDGAQATILRNDPTPLSFVFVTTSGQGVGEGVYVCVGVGVYVFVGVIVTVLVGVLVTVGVNVRVGV